VRTTSFLNVFHLTLSPLSLSLSVSLLVLSLTNADTSEVAVNFTKRFISAHVSDVKYRMSKTEFCI